MQWIALGPLTGIPQRGARCIDTPEGRIAVFRTGDDQVFAIDDRCPHKGGPLSQGIVHGTSITCPLHNWVISLESGKAEGADEGCVRTIPMKIEDGILYLALNLQAERAA
jgi:nitrite reductase (NADH) small subunit